MTAKVPVMVPRLEAVALAICPPKKSVMVNDGMSVEPVGRPSVIVAAPVDEATIAGRLQIVNGRGK
ncbi:MAG TPA: hypothetical protein PK636_08105, partial [bacterium]|nr:hypothetical protein [bacterium]